jgi:hypothetical protein
MAPKQPEGPRRVKSQEELRALLLPESKRELRTIWRPESRVEFLDSLERYLDFERWGFHPALIDPRPGRFMMIYESAQCRVRLSPSFEREPGQGSMYSYFGRSHAPDGDTFMEWQGERCFAWHNIAMPEFYWFLEGCSVEEAGERRRRRSEWPAWAAYQATELGKRLRGMEWSIASEGFLWDYYGERLFSLFDLRQPERWEALRRYIREYFEKVEPDRLNDFYLKVWHIPPWNVC